MKSQSVRRGSPPGRAVARGIAAAVAAAAALLTAPPAVADEAEDPTSTGIYRIPYADGTDVTVTDVLRDTTIAYDLSAGAGTEVVAAAAGWIRAIADERPPRDTYVWIEHPNGEYTRYSHLGTGTVSERWSEGDWVEAGAVLGLESGGASATGGSARRASELRWELAVPDAPGAAVTWDERDGSIDSGAYVVARVCDVPGQQLAEGEEVVAAACDHSPPSAALGGGPFVVDEGDAIGPDATQSSDPDGLPLTYRWQLGDLFLPATESPELTLRDDFAGALTLTVYDRVEALGDAVTQEITVRNVPPAVSVIATPAVEGAPATVRATVADPGTDTFAAEIDWGDGGPAEPVTIPQLARGVDHVYADDGSYAVAVTVTDDDGGVGVGGVPLEISNVTPEGQLTLPGDVAFPGGDFAVVGAGGDLEASAAARDEGSDDLAFAWSSGSEATVFNDGSLPDPPLSPSGTAPFEASDVVTVGFPAAGVGYVAVTIADDDGATTDASAGVVVTGTADASHGRAWWLREFAGIGERELDPAVAVGYLDAIAAVSEVFDETYAVGTTAEAAMLLSPSYDDGRAKAVAELLTAWLHFASGAVPWDAEVTLDGVTVPFLDLMSDAEDALTSPATGEDEIRRLAQDLARARHATR